MTETLGFLAAGFEVALKPVNLLWGFIGVTLGTFVGVLPGVGPALTVAMLLPLTVKLDQASIGGDLVGALDLAVAAKDGVVTVERLNAELPGENRIEASGRLTQSEGRPVFEGPIKVEGSKLRTLARWAAGDREMSGQATVGAFTLSAKTTIGGGTSCLTTQAAS